MTHSPTPPARRARRLYFLGCVLLAATTGGAIEIVVRNNNNLGPGSLRQAVIDNNGLGGGNVISFSNTVTGTITLTSGELVISTNVIIRGPGPSVLNVSGNNSSRIFNITGGTVDISGLSMTNARSESGSAVFSLGHLSLSNCLVTTCRAQQAGGGIYSSGRLNASRCAFVGNTASLGGALVLSGVSILKNCTILGNTSFEYGGGIHNSGELNITDCTIAGNQTAGTGYGGGILGNATVRNTIIAMNASASGSDAWGTYISEGYNLIGKINGSTGWGAVGDQLGTTASPINPILLPLGNYGGPTPTMPPASGSTAIDQGRSFGITTDQRGRPRAFDNPTIINATLGDGTDIGAVEVGPVALVVTSTNDSGHGSLRQTLLDASPNEGDTVTFAPNVTNSITLTSGQIDISKRLEIYGPGARLLRVGGNNTTRVFNLSGGNVILTGLTIAHGSATEGGGIRVAGGSHQIYFCQIVSNTATAGGGLLVTSNAVLNLYNSSVTHNLADFSGGGIAHNGSNTLSVVSCTVASNRLTFIPNEFLFPRGGGIALSFGSLVVVNSTLAGNSSTSFGGGLDNQSFYPGTVDIRNSIVAGNSAPSFGPDVAGAFLSSGYNLIANSSGSSGFGATGDQLNVNPMLGPLAYYGGPTPTMALRAGSPAIDAGKSFGSHGDQRVSLRPLDDPAIANAVGGDGADIGSLEVDPRFRIVEMRRLGGDVALSLMTMLGRNYRAEHTNNLGSSNWTTFANSTPGNGHLLWVTNSGGANQSRRFYRGAIVP